MCSCTDLDGGGGNEGGRNWKEIEYIVSCIEVEKRSIAFLA